MLDWFQKHYLDYNRLTQPQEAYEDVAAKATSILRNFEEAAVDAIIAAAENDEALVYVIASEAIRRHNWRAVTTLAAGAASESVQRLRLEDVEEVIQDAKKFIQILLDTQVDN